MQFITKLAIGAVGSAVAFQVYKVPLNSSLKYEEITFRQKLDSWKTRPLYPFHRASSGRLIRSSLAGSTLPNGFIEAVHLACTNHHGLRLSPDAIFFAILEGLACKIKSDVDLDDLFEYGGPKNIVNSWFGGFKDGDEWEDMIIGLQEYEKENVNPDLYRDFEAHFSTSTQLSSSFFPLMLKSRVNIASLNRKWVSALPSSHARCSIPEVRLDGHPGDWRQIRQRTESILTRLGIDDWKRNLIPVLDQFVSASKGLPNATFWKQIYKREDAPNQDHVSGWINAFFPAVRKRIGFIDNSCTSEDLNTCAGFPIGAYPVLETTYMFIIRYWFNYYVVNVALEMFGTQKDQLQAFITPTTGWSVFLSQSYPLSWTW